MRSRIRAVTLLITLVAVALSAPSARAIPQSSQITTPAVTTYPLNNTDVPGTEITVAGTVAGATEVNIRCYSGPSPTDFVTYKANVPVSGGSFSLTSPAARSRRSPRPVACGPCRSGSRRHCRPGKKPNSRVR